MGEVIQFPSKKKKKGRKQLDFPIMFHPSGFGINPLLIERIVVGKNGTLYFVFDSVEGSTPEAAMQLLDQRMAGDVAEALAWEISENFGREIDVQYD